MSERIAAGGTASAALRLQPIHDAIGPHAARSLDQHQVAGADQRRDRRRRPRRSSRSDARASRGMPAATAASASAARRRAADGEQQRRRRPRPRRGRTSSCSAVAWSPSSSISPSTATRRVARVSRASTSSARFSRRRARVVAVVDDRDAARQPHDLAAMRRRLQRGGALGDRRRAARRTRAPPRSRPARSPGCRGRAAASSASTLAARRRDARAACRRCRGLRRRVARTSAPRSMPNVTTRPAKRRDPRRITRRRRRCATSSGRRRRAFEDLGLGVGDRVERREEAEVRLADVGPHADVRLGDARPAC